MPGTWIPLVAGCRNRHVKASAVGDLHRRPKPIGRKGGAGGCESVAGATSRTCEEFEDGFLHRVHNDLPNDNEIETFFKQTRWTPTLGSRTEYFSSSDDRTITTRLTAGGINPVLWKKILNREVPTSLFPELKRAADSEQ